LYANGYGLYSLLKNSVEKNMLYGIITRGTDVAYQIRNNMPLELTPSPKLTYKLRLTPQMRLSLNLLQLPLVKLKEYIKQEIEKNPVLELIDKGPKPPKEGAGLSWTEKDEEKKEYIESLITKPPTLQEHLLTQLQILVHSDDERKIGEFIIGNITDDGYLGCAIEEIAESNKVVESQVEKLLVLIQSFDPMGVGARDLRECLLIQLKAKGKENSLTGRIVDKYLSHLGKKRYEHIAKKLKVSTDKVKEAMKEIARFEPKPGRSFNTERAVCLIPDASLKKTKGGYETVLNDWDLPQLNMNDKYKKMIKQKDTPRDAKEYLMERLKAARTLINAIERRKETIQKIIEDIVYVQRDFLDTGTANFKPMTQNEIANRIGKHKSTVSRAISNKYLQTPHGIFELRYFLSSGIKQENNASYASKNIMTKISELIRNEDKKNPLTDREMVNRFGKDGISVSRRTITKYREHLKILPSKSRQE